jgi:phosphoglycerate dehydrogenase-like enzyme
LSVGLVGHGVIGSRAAEVWRALGARVHVSDPRLGPSPDIHELAETCELISLHCDLNASSREIVDASVLERMKPGSVLLNTARGGLVDVDALMRTDHLGGLGLDVFPQEPFPHLAELASRPGVLLLPHAAGYHRDLGVEVARELAEAVGAYLAGLPLPHPVTAG